MPQRLNDCSGMGMGRNGKSLVGIPWKWELVTKLEMGIGYKIGNGNGKEWKLTAWEWEEMKMLKTIPGHLY